jgi:tetratricopeptide (TPR) repeat protein
LFLFKIIPNTSEFHVEKATALRCQKGKIAESIECIDEALLFEMIPKKRLDLYMHKAKTLCFLRDKERAMECVDKAFKDCPADREYILSKKNEFLQELNRNVIMVNDLW